MDVSPTRDFNYVTDKCDGFIALAGAEASVGRTVNIASNYKISVADTLDLIRDIMGSDVEFLPDPERMRRVGSEVFHLWGDNRLMTELTGFTLRTTLRDGLKRTVDWFSDPANLARYKADRYNVSPRMIDTLIRTVRTEYGA